MNLMPFLKKPSTINWRQKRHGFTLVELLVVISLIGILATIGSISFTASQKRARDAKRKNDIAQIQKALELYYNDNKDYPQVLGCCNDIEVVLKPLLVPNYIKELPKDPHYSATVYHKRYNYYNLCGSYTLYAWLENAQDPDGTGACGESSPKFTEGGDLIYAKSGP